MAVSPLKSEDIGLPLFDIDPKDVASSDFGQLTLFDLSSHARANEAIQFGLKMRGHGFHIFVIGEDRSGRMTATLEFLNNYVSDLPAPDDWVYLNNFKQQHRPRPFRLPAGKGYELKQTLSDLVGTVHSILSKTFSHPHYTSQIDAMASSLEDQIRSEIEAVNAFAQTKGYTVETSEEGFTLHPLESLEQVSSEPGATRPPHNQQDINEIRERLNRITTSAHLASRQLAKQVFEAKKSIAEQVVTPLLARFTEQFGQYLDDWIETFKEDILENFEEFLPEDPNAEQEMPLAIAERYAVNLLVDHKETDHPAVVLEPNPTYENLFGSIQYRSMPGGGLETNFTLIRPGALHRANGGILVLRSDAIAKDPEVWDALKAALRDQKIRIIEHHREHTLPLLEAPAPQTIPLDVQIFIIGAPTWYYTFFFNDPDFRNYFKIKADIDPELPVTRENVSVYTRLIRQSSLKLCKKEIQEDAIQYLMGYSARWTNHRHKLSSKFELIEDVLAEASAGCVSQGAEAITKEDIKNSIRNRHRRIARLEDRTHEDIESGVILIDTKGQSIGQVNALSMIMMGDHQFGIPSRVSAKTYAGKHGVINVERLTDMGGPIQQKATLILEGFIHGLFAQRFPVSFSASLTFEQNYSGVEGDSASVAELMVILSSLSEIPIRQDVAITGSINQLGTVQAVGGINYKIEGFFRTCRHRGLTGTQGVIVPWSNIENITLKDDVQEAVQKGLFSIWPIKTVEEALEMMMGLPAGAPDKTGNFPPDTIYGHVFKKLKYYHSLLLKENYQKEKLKEE